jgi:hypothetical protein
MTVERMHPSGAYRIDDVIGGYLVTKWYYGYTKREAIKLFKEQTR